MKNFRFRSSTTCKLLYFKKKFKIKEKNFVYCYFETKIILFHSKQYKEKCLINIILINLRSKTMRSSFAVGKKLKAKFKPFGEIGSNDGTFIKNFDKDKVVGVEPCEFALITKKRNIKFTQIFGILIQQRKLPRK